MSVKDKTRQDCISSRFFENQPNEICSQLSEKTSTQKAFFLSPRSSKIIVTKEKERRKRKSEEKEKKEKETKAMVALSVFIIATLEK